MKKIVTIGGGNGHSSILKLFSDFFNKNDLEEKYFITAIVSMSDDGRTTGVLMRQMQEHLGVHMPPPGDLRKCALSLSKSIYKEKFHTLFETVIIGDKRIIDYTIKDILNIIDIDSELYDYFEQFDGKILNFVLPLNSSINGHKFGNILMATIYYNYGDYYKMIDLLSAMLKIKGRILPVTIDKAFIFAELRDNEIIDTQDNISNVVNYSAPLRDLRLSRDSMKAKVGESVIYTIDEADYIIIGPGDLFTSINSNFLIDGIKDAVNESEAKKIYIMNSNNKKGETTNYNEIDFVDFIVNSIGISLDLLVASNKKPNLNKEERERFVNDISVKGGRYLYLDKKKELEIKNKYPNIELLVGDYIDKKTLYKNNSKMIEDLVGWM